MSAPSGTNKTDNPEEMAGYPKLAWLMSLESETAIVRRFGDLNMLNILRLQAELHDMERELKQIREDDASSNDAIRIDYSKDFRLMRDWQETGDSEQYDMLIKIGSKLQEYNLAVSQALAQNRVQRPTRRELDFLRTWLIRPNMGNQFLRDVEASTYDPSNDHDLISLSNRPRSSDSFTRFIYGRLLDIHHLIWGSKAEHPSKLKLDEGIKKYEDARLIRLSNTISSVISALLPTIVILVLYFVNKLIVRIGLVIVFTALFSLALSTFTEANRVESFSATAAFAAVEVVFIGSTSTNSTG